MTATAKGNSVLLSREDKIDKALDRGIAGNLAVNLASGGASFRDMAEVMEFAKIMSLSRQAVPAHCREQPGVCLGVTLQSIEWRMSPFAVANKSYVVNDRLSYESQLIHAVIEQRAPVKGRLRHEFKGEGKRRTCRVWAMERETGEELSYTSPEFDTITPKNSPLWKSKPDLQLFYNTSRDWARVYYPDVIMGVYSDDELAAVTIEQSPPARRLPAVPMPEPKSYVTSDGSDPADAPEPESSDHEDEAGDDNQQPDDDAAVNQEPEGPKQTPLARLFELCCAAEVKGDVAELNRLNDEYMGENANWGAQTDDDYDKAKEIIAEAKVRLEKRANRGPRSNGKTE